MSNKLILTIDKSVIKKANTYAKAKGYNLSDLVEEYLKSITKEDKEIDNIQLSPITKSLYGSVKIDDSNLDYKKILADEIFKKHLRGTE